MIGAGHSSTGRAPGLGPGGSRFDPECPEFDMKIRIRKAAEKDLPALLSLYAQPGMDNGSVVSAQKAREIFRKMKSYPDYGVYVAEAGGKIAGTFALLVMDNLAHKGTPSAVIEDVVVEAGLRGKGIGGKMMAFALGLCGKKGCYKAALSSNLGRKAAHKFYESLGFERHGYSFSLVLSQEKSKADKRRGKSPFYIQGGVS